MTRRWFLVALGGILLIIGFGDGISIVWMLGVVAIATDRDPRDRWARQVT